MSGTRTGANRKGRDGDGSDRREGRGGRGERYGCRDGSRGGRGRDRGGRGDRESGTRRSRDEYEDQGGGNGGRGRGGGRDTLKITEISQTSMAHAAAFLPLQFPAISNTKDGYARVGKIIFNYLQLHGSDKTRSDLETANCPFNPSNCLRVMDLASCTIADLLQVRIFTPPPPPPPPIQRKRVQTKNDCSVSSTMRKELKNFIKYNVHFTKLDEATCFPQDVVDENDPKKMEFLYADCMNHIISQSFMFSREDEILQLQTVAITFNNILGLYNFKMTIQAAPKPDFYFCCLEEGNESRLHGEGKKTVDLPFVPKSNNGETAADLCHYGFATRLAKTKFTEDDKTKNLLRTLGIDGDRKNSDQNETKFSFDEASELSRDIIEGASEWLRIDPANSTLIVPIKSDFTGTGISTAQYSLRLWTAVMQACFAAVKNSEKYAIVLGGGTWFLSLSVSTHTDQDGKESKVCYIGISDCISNGSKNYFKRLLAVLLKAKSKSMNIDDRKAFEFALYKNQNSKPTKSNPDSPKQGDKTNNENSTDSNARDESQNTQKRSSTPCTSLRRKVSVDENDLEQKYMDYHRLAENVLVPIPYFYQIEDVVGVLGNGRCGSVQKIRWANGYAALKGYLNINYEDGRYFYDVYEKELSILLELHDLWGVHVPALLFHKPWDTNPCIGLQLGEPIESFDNWSEEDQKLLQETVNKVREYGYYQSDFRACNFVRLESNGVRSIAMIDFESLERVE